MADNKLETLTQENTTLKARLFDLQEGTKQLEHGIEIRNNIIIQVARMVFGDDTLEEITFDELLKQVEKVTDYTVEVEVDGEE